MTAQDPRVREILARRGVVLGDPGPAVAGPPDDPDAAEVEARKAEVVARRAGETPARVRRCGACASAIGTDGVCRSCHPDAPPVPGKPPRMRHAAKAGSRCVDCGGRLNAFTGECPRCHSPQPNGFDAEPVRLAEAPAWESPRGGTNGDGPGRAAPAPAGTPSKPCRTCGEPTRPNGRCYRCRPGGGRGKPEGTPTPARKTGPVPEPAAGLAPTPPGPRPAGDPLSEALDLVERLDALTPAAFERLVAFVRARKGGVS